MKLGKRCKHGLYCACFICNFENENEQLKQEIEALKSKVATLEASHG